MLESSLTKVRCSGLGCLPTFRNKFAVSWPPEDERKPARALYLSPRALFEQAHQSDVHFAAYQSSTLCRLNSEAVGKTDWAMTTFVVDVDCPKALAVDQWFELEKPKLEQAFAQTPIALAYRSKSGGYRLLWWLEKPYKITSPRNLIVWRKNYLLALLALYSRFGILADPSCGDATRIFRAPKVWLAESRTQTRGELLCSTNENTLPKGFFSPNDQEIGAGKALANLSESWRKAMAWLFPVQPQPPASMPPRPSSNESAPILLRAEKYLENMPPSISGQDGQKALWNAAFALTKGFGLSEQDAMFLLEYSFNPRCRPPWSQKDIKHKVNDAKLSNKKEGWLLSGDASLLILIFCVG